jgi:signal transduction histidine kinase
LESLTEAVIHHGQAAAERSRVEGKLSHLSHRLVQVNRLSMLGSLAGVLGHELSNITTIYQATVQKIEAEAQRGQPPEQKHLETLRRIGGQLLSHSVHLRNLARPHRTARQDLDLRTVVADTLRMLSDVGKTKYIQLDAILPREPAVIKATRTQIEQVLINLIGNAVDALQDLPGFVRVRVKQDMIRSRVTCDVEDNGCGIPPDRLEEIFQTYYTTKPPGKGTGLGLAIARQIMEAHGGTLSVTSRLGQGSTFTLDFPEAAGQSHGD